MSSEMLNSVVTAVGGVGYRSQKNYQTIQQLNNIITTRCEDLSLEGLMKAIQFYSQPSTYNMTPLISIKIAVNKYIEELTPNQCVSVLDFMRYIRQEDEELCQKLCGKLHLQLNELQMSELSQLFKALSSFKFRDELLMTLIIDQFKTRLFQLTFNDIALILGAMAALRYQDLAFQKRLITIVRLKVHEGNKIQWMEMLEHLGKFKIYDQELVGKIASLLLDHIPSFSSSQLVQIAASLSQLRHHCNALINAIDQALISKLAELKSFMFVRLLFAYRNLHNTDLQLNMDPYIKHALNKFDSFSLERIVEICYSFAVIGEWNEEFWSKATRLLKSLDVSQLQDRVKGNSTMLIRIQKLAEINGIRSFELPVNLRKESVRAWKELQSRCAASAWQLRIYNMIKEIGYENAVLAHETEDELMQVDVMVEIDGQKLAIEADGPDHFTSNFPCYVTHKTLIRDKLLQNLGYKVVSIPFYEWKMLIEHDREQQYLKKKIQQALKQVE
eukprot:TRINITY_DN17093_c0_g3_i2.p1 TRINITY_DN17093_c0_g3~~TRINITY_DN17093_c0_g3_i2.p1  ORF type:complete len:550 (-),score=48.53 TRINITY_DN17093_c0_g3_i2:313-1815(-)